MGIMEGIFGIAWVFIIGYVVKTFLDYRVQRLIIEKNLVDEKLTHLFNKPVLKDGISSIKWGLVLIGMGLGFLARQFWPDIFTEEGTAGLIFLLGGIGFIIYYLISKKANGN